MDILRFINSKDIREHLRNIGYEFNSPEASWLICQCRDSTVDEKHKAWNELIETMADRPIGYAESSIPLDYPKSGMIPAGLSKPEHIKIWLDDIREAPVGYFHCHSVNETIRKIIECEKECAVIDEINCDHDLGDYASDGGDGIKLIDWLAERKTYYPVKLHTMNPVGRENMQREIDRYWNKTK